jgi:hypothetical protein
MGQSANNKNTDSLSTGEIVGISIAASSFMLIMIGLAIKLIRRRFL